MPGKPSRKQRNKNRDILRRLKERTPCSDCGGFFPWYVTDWDHVSGQKLFNVSNGCSRTSLDRILAELAKCQLVCANCHRERTYQRRTAERTAKNPQRRTKQKRRAH